jgi:hypothetical protein
MRRAPEGSRRRTYRRRERIFLTSARTIRTPQQKPRRGRVCSVGSGRSYRRHSSASGIQRLSTNATGSPLSRGRQSSGRHSRPSTALRACLSLPKGQARGNRAVSTNATGSPHSRGHNLQAVIPAQAGIHRFSTNATGSPAFAGTTIFKPSFPRKRESIGFRHRAHDSSSRPSTRSEPALSAAKE